MPEWSGDEVREVETGVSHASTGDWTYFVGGGVATFDCAADGDGAMDLVALRAADLERAGGTRVALTLESDNRE